MASPLMCTDNFSNSNSTPIQSTLFMDPSICPSPLISIPDLILELQDPDINPDDPEAEPVVMYLYCLLFLQQSLKLTVDHTILKLYSYI